MMAIVFEKLRLSVVAAGLLAMQSCLAGGCMSFSAVEGAGRIGLGYKSETTVFVYHTVDGDKVGKTATMRSGVSLDLPDPGDVLGGASDNGPKDEEDEEETVVVTEGG